MKLSVLIVLLMLLWGKVFSGTLNVCIQGCPYSSVQAAINAAQNGDVIRVAQGRYVENLVINKNITLNGGYSGPPNWDRDIDAYETILDGNGAGSVMRITLNYSPIIDGFTITGGYANYGGGVYISGSSPTLRHNVIQTNNAGVYGGGVYVIGSIASPLLDANQIIENNSSNNGGGIFINDYSKPLFINNIVARNSSNSNGTGIYIDYYSEPRIINNTIVANNGGPHWAREGIVMFNCPIPVIRNNIIANHQGCGIRGGPCSDDSISCNDLWNNNPNYCGITPGPCDISVDPLFIVSDTTYHLQCISPVIDQGTDEGAPPTDIDGESRPFCEGVDIGADEVVEDTCCIMSINDQSQSLGLAATSFILHQNYPNPFNPTTTIQYDLSTSAQLKLAIFDVSGQLVKILFSGRQSVGAYSVQWDGTGHSGRLVPSGVYFYRLATEASSSVRRMILLR